MKWFLSVVLALVLLGTLVLPGCQRVNVEKEMDLANGEVKWIIVDPPKREQKIVVEVTCDPIPVDVVVVDNKNQKATEDALLTNKKLPVGNLGAKENVSKDSLEATVPAGTECAVGVFNKGNKPTHVKLKVKSK